MRVFTIGMAATLASGFAFSHAAAEQIDVELYSDFRLSHAEGEKSWFEGRLGKSRYGGQGNGKGATRFRVAELSLVAKIDLSWDIKAFVHTKYDPEQEKPIDLVEAYVRYAPVPKSSISYSLKAGLFFPHISRENIGIAWTSPYSITSSAISSWVGEEVRALGFEAKTTYKSGAHALDATVAAFGFNDTTGSLLAFRGWALGDAKVGAFSRLPLAPTPGIGPESGFLLSQGLFTVPVKEVDDRVGFYGALDYSYNNWLQLGAFFYDNRGDPEVTQDQQYSWDTRYWNFYTESDIGSGIKLIGQYMTGNTIMGFRFGAEQLRQVDANFDAAYILATKSMGQYRLTARYDWFDVEDNSFLDFDDNTEDGSAFTVAFAAKLGKKTSVIAEYLRIDSERPSRLTIGQAPDQFNNVFQLSLRQRF